MFCVLRLGSRMEVRETDMISHVLGCFRQLGKCNKVFPLLSAPCTSGQAEFTDLVGENSPFLSALLKVYKKKVGWSKLRRMLSWALSIRLKMGYWCTMVHPWIWGYTHFQAYPVVAPFSAVFLKLPIDQRWSAPSERRAGKRRTSMRMRRMKTMRRRWLWKGSLNWLISSYVHIINLSYLFFNGLV